MYNADFLEFVYEKCYSNEKFTIVRVLITSVAIAKLWPY